MRRSTWPIHILVLGSGGAVALAMAGRRFKAWRQRHHSTARTSERQEHSMWER